MKRILLRLRSPKHVSSRTHVSAAIMSTSCDVIFRLGNLTRADGSAVAASGNSAVQVAVHGPGEVPLHKELLEEAAVEVVFKDAARSKDGMCVSLRLQSH